MGLVDLITGRLTIALIYKATLIYKAIKFLMETTMTRFGDDVLLWAEEIIE